MIITLADKLTLWRPHRNGLEISDQPIKLQHTPTVADFNPHPEQIAPNIAEANCSSDTVDSV